MKKLSGSRKSGQLLQGCREVRRGEHLRHTCRVCGTQHKALGKIEVDFVKLDT